MLRKCILGMLLFAPATTFGAWSPISQDRSVAALANSSYYSPSAIAGFTDPEIITNSQMFAAADFLSFSNTASANVSATHTASSSAVQDSILESSTISASGSLHALICGSGVLKR